MGKSDLISGNNEKTLTADEVERWRYPRFFTDDMALSAEDEKHLRTVLRMKEGQLVVLCDGNGTDTLAKIVSLTPLTLEPLDKRQNTADPKVKIRLFQCLPKSDKFDFIVQKATELGVAEIVPVLSARCVSRPDSKSMAKKLLRYQKIAAEAAKQCGGGKIPKVCDLISFKEIFPIYNDDAMGIIFYECGGKSISSIMSNASPTAINIIVGSEGGFSAEEVEIARKSGYHVSTLGERILRTETAPIAALAILLNLTDFG